MKERVALYVLKIIPVRPTNELCLTLKEDRADTKRTEKMKDKMPTLRKIKRAAIPHTKPTFCRTFAFSLTLNVQTDKNN